MNVRESVDRSWGRFLAQLRAAGDGDWSRPTRLAGWAVADLAAHAVWGASMEADALRRWRTGADGRAEGRTVDASAGPDALTAAFEQARQELLDELARLDDGDPARPVPMAYFDVPLADVLTILVMEAGVHASDLLAAFGQDDALPGDVTAASAAFLATFGPVVASQATERPPDGTVVALAGPRVDLRFAYVDGAWTTADRQREPDVTLRAPDDSTLVLYAFGRVASGVEPPDAGRAFKRWFPGP